MRPARFLLLASLFLSGCVTEPLPGSGDRPRDENPPPRDETGNPPPGTVLGRVTDRPGYCYILDANGSSVVAPCP